MHPFGYLTGRYRARNEDDFVSCAQRINATDVTIQLVEYRDGEFGLTGYRTIREGKLFMKLIARRGRHRVKWRLPLGSDLFSSSGLVHSSPRYSEVESRGQPLVKRLMVRLPHVTFRQQPFQHSEIVLNDASQMVNG